MARTIEIIAHTYDELSDAAKAAARDWWRKASEGDDFYSEFVISDAQEVARRLGVEFKEKIIRSRGGHSIAAPCIYWSGFYSQGDGASYEGSYQPNVHASEAVRAHAPKDETLHSIADQLSALAFKHGTDFTIEITHRGCLWHSNTMYFEPMDSFGSPMDVSSRHIRTRQAAPTIADDFAGPLRAFADWIYRQLESSYEDYFSDESIAETIRANEFEFTADGSRCACLD